MKKVYVLNCYTYNLDDYYDHPENCPYRLYDSYEKAKKELDEIHNLQSYFDDRNKKSMIINISDFENERRIRYQYGEHDYAYEDTWTIDCLDVY